MQHASASRDLLWAVNMGPGHAPSASTYVHPMRNVLNPSQFRKNSEFTHIFCRTRPWYQARGMLARWSVRARVVALELPTLEARNRG